MCAFSLSPGIKRIWLQKSVESKDLLTVIPFEKNSDAERIGWLLFHSPWTNFTRRDMHFFLHNATKMLYKINSFALS